MQSFKSNLLQKSRCTVKPQRFRLLSALSNTLRTQWSWQKYCLNHCARTCCSLRNVTRCRFTNWRIRCEWGGRNVHFLSINLISFRRSRGIVLVKPRVFRSRPNPHRHRQRHWQSASSLGRYLWLARLVSVWKAPPSDVTAAIRVAPTQWRCGSNSTTAFGVYLSICYGLNAQQRFSNKWHG